MANIIDGLIDAGKAVPMIVVIPSGDIYTNFDFGTDSGYITKIFYGSLCSDQGEKLGSKKFVFDCLFAG
jgi:hypothetical protein